MHGNNKNETTPQHQQGGACAACKHQRKKCSANCALAPYFPASRHREFEAVHKVFGVSNMSKLVKYVKEDHRRKVVESLIWEAFCRQQDPILGSYGHYKKVYDQYTNLLQKLHHNNADQHHHQILHHQLSLSHHHQDLKSFHQNHHLVMSGAEGSSVDEDDGLGFIHNHKNNNNNMIMDSSSLYGPDFSHIDDFKSEVVTNQFQQHHHPPYYYSGQQFN